MPPSWSGIKARAAAFARDWADAADERAQARILWIALFDIFAIHRADVVSIEHAVNKQGRVCGFIDLF